MAQYTAQKSSKQINKWNIIGNNKCRMILSLEQAVQMQAMHELRRQVYMLEDLKYVQRIKAFSFTV